jgi:PDZ domain-containing protein
LRIAFSTCAALAVALAPGCITVRHSAVEIHEPEAGVVVPADEEGGTVTKRTLNVGHGGILTVEDLSAKRKGFAGATVGDIDERVAKKRGLVPFDGVLVTAVERDSPAEIAGLLPGDQILEYRNEKATSAAWLRFRFEQTPPDETVPLVVKRGNGTAGENALTLKLKMGARTEDVRNVHSYQLRYLRDSRHVGVEVGELTPALRKRYFGGEDGPTLIVTDVTKRKPAHIGNLRELDVIRSVNGRPMRSLEDLESLLKGLDGGEDLTFEVWRRGGSAEASVESASDIQKSTSFTIPLIVSYESEYRESDFDLLLFLFGYKAWDEWRDDGREVEVRRCHDVGFLLDLIEWESNYDRKTFSLLWFIKFHSSRS